MLKSSQKNNTQINIQYIYLTKSTQQQVLLHQWYSSRSLSTSASEYESCNSNEQELTEDNNITRSWAIPAHKDTHLSHSVYLPKQLYANATRNTANTKITRNVGQCPM